MGWWRRYLLWRQRNVCFLELNPGGFVLRGKPHTAMVAWDQVVRILAYERDLVTIDLLCVAVELPTGLVEIHEDMRGYESVEAAMEQHFAFAPDWKLGVIFPAFAPNFETLFDRTSLESARAPVPA